MLKKIFGSVDNLFKRSKKTVRVSDSFSRKNDFNKDYFSKNALETVKRIQQAGFDAFLVGGCIRDLLLNVQPKDFDVATNATPEQVKKIFRNSRIIGRRFKLVHVFWGRETIEVATFRGPHDMQEDAVSQNTGRILRDNVYGTMEQDAYRRDFTINAFYYDITKKRVLDPVGGLADIDNRVLRIIGDPNKRYLEDPVRMLRAIRFAAKLDFKMETETDNAIHALSTTLKDIPAARLFDEVLKLFLSGHAVITFELLRHYHLFEILFPLTAKALEQNSMAESFIKQSLINTDERLSVGKTVNPAFLYATLLWPVLVDRLEQPFMEHLPNLHDLQDLGNQVIFEQGKYTTIPKRFATIMREIWDAQIRLAKRQGKKADALLENPRFRAGYDFLLLRESVGENTGGLGEWWTIYQQLDEPKRRAMIRQLSGDTTKKTTGKRKRYYKPKVKAKADPSS